MMDKGLVVFQVRLEILWSGLSLNFWMGCKI